MGGDRYHRAEGRSPSFRRSEVDTGELSCRRECACAENKKIKEFSPINIGDLELYNGDCLEVMDYLIDNKIIVDSVICDPPYGNTGCKWDSVIPFK